MTYRTEHIRQTEGQNEYPIIFNIAAGLQTYH